MTYALISYIYINRLVMYTIAMFWGAMCLNLVFCLSIRRVGDLGTLDQFSYMQTW